MTDEALDILMEAMPDALIVCDGAERITLLNPAAERLLGWTRAELVGEPLTRLLPERLHTVEGQSLPRYLLRHPGYLGGRPLRAPALRRDGVELVVELTVGARGKGARERLVLSLRRMPELVEPALGLAAEQHPAQLREGPAADEAPASGRLYRTVVENAPLGIFHFDRTPVITTCNDYFVRIIGSSKRVLIGLNLLTLRDAAIAGCVRAALEGRRSRYEGEYHSMTADKRTPVRVHFAPCCHEDGTVTGGVGIVEDITEHRRAEEERARLLREAQEAVRVREDFLTIASHELKTPLTPLSLRLAHLERRLERGERVDVGVLRQARQHLQRLTFLINDLLDASRIEAGRLALHPEPTRLDGLVEHVIHGMEAHRGDRHIEFSHPAQAVQVLGDAYRLEQVIANLLENALKYSPHEGTVRLDLQVREDVAVLSVSDEGIGIPPEDQKLLFERYFRARNSSSRSFGGLGLGLYISRDIVERHGGRIWVESEVGRGSTFYVALPLLESERAPLSEHPGRHLH